MSYCPTCHHEYAESVTRCIDCGANLKAGNRPVYSSVGLDDNLIPIAAAMGGLVALALLLLRIGAGAGWFSASVAAFVFATQPIWMTVLLALALLSCCVILLIIGVQSLAGRR